MSEKSKKPTIEEISAGLIGVCAQGIDHAKGYGNSAISRYMVKLCISIHRHHDMIMEQVRPLIDSKKAQKEG